MLLFSDQKLALKEFSRSQYLPVPQDYKTRAKNPILSCLVDQMKQDSELSEKYPDQATLLKGIIEALETRKISWPNGFTLMSSEQWIQRMKTNHIFYFHHARNSSEMQKYEDLLLDLAAQCLKRQINLIPFLEQDKASTFKPQAKIWAKFVSMFSGQNLANEPQFNLLSCQKLRHNNFFLSVFKQD